MAKASGGTRNYSNSPKILKNRRDEYDALMATGLYNEEYSEFDASGGFVVVDKGYNRPNEIKSLEDKSEYAIDILIRKGYKLYMNNENSTIEFDKKNDGRIYQHQFDFKTINSAGKSSIKRAIEDASKQNVGTVILIQNDREMKREYVEKQIDLFIDKSPIKAVEKINHIIVVGMSGNVHRRDIRKDKERRLKK